MPNIKTATLFFTLNCLLSTSFSQNLKSGIFVSQKDTVIINEMGDNYLSYFNIHTGRIGTLLKINGTKFFLGSVNQRPDSLGTNKVASIIFEKDSKKFNYININGTNITYSKLPYKEKIVTIPTAGGITLSGKIIIPSRSHKVPLIVIGHGSELVSKDFYKEAYLFASWGIATLVYDKRGVGQSLGEKNPDIFDQATDLSSAASFVSNLPEIDSNKIGVWAVSQGGWVTPLTLIHQPLFNFALILSGPATTAFEEDIAGIRKSLKFFNFSKFQQDEATDLMSEIYMTIEHEENWSNLEFLKSKYKNEKWYALMQKQSLVCSYFLGDQASYIKAHFKEILASNTYTHWCFYNPARYIKRIYQPVLWLYGTEDKSIPVTESIGIINNIKNTYKNQFEIKIINKMNHAGFIDENTGIEDYDHIKNVSPEYISYMKTWLKKKSII